MAALPWVQRDISWLRFNERVLAQAMRPDCPLLERCRFLGITAENLDEFYMVRLAKWRNKPDTAGNRRIFQTLCGAVKDFVHRQYACWDELQGQLEASGISLLGQQQWDVRQRHMVAVLFRKKIQPL